MNEKYAIEAIKTEMDKVQSSVEMVFNVGCVLVAFLELEGYQQLSDIFGEVLYTIS